VTGAAIELIKLKKFLPSSVSLETTTQEMQLPPPPPRQYVSRVSFDRLRAATSSFAEANKIGSGATGDVYRGDLDGAPVAVKVLKLKVRSPEVRAATELAFRRELGVLSQYRHARLVKILGFASSSSEADSEAPFALVFEFLSEGSLADWLRAPNGSAPKKTRAGGAGLSAIERVDIALGAAGALSFLHGQEAHVGDSSGGGAEPPAAGAGAAPPVLPSPSAVVLHRDVKAANIGITKIGGALYAKLLDCGLAKAVKGDDAAVGTSNSAGFVGTAGYVARELADGATEKTDLYALGVVLVEILTGTRAGTRKDDVWTAIGIFDEFEDAGGAAGLVARADSSWPRAAADALANLAIECIHNRAARRPSGATIIARLHEVRALVDEAGTPLVLCPVCLCDVPESQIQRCSAADAHPVCNACLQSLVVSSCDTNASFSKNGGRVKCAVSGCVAAQGIEDLISEARLEKSTYSLYFRAVRSFVQAPQRKREHDDAILLREKAALEAALALSDRVQKQRALVLDADFTLRCPRCALPFADYTGCNALVCQDYSASDAGRARSDGNVGCGAGFCGICLADCGADAHDHYYRVHGPEIFDRRWFEATHKEARLKRVIARVRALAPDDALQKALVLELAKADLAPLSITADEIVAGVGCALPLSPLPTDVERQRVLDTLKDAAIDARRVVAVLREFARDPGICSEAAKVMTNLTLVSANQQSAVDAGAPAALVAAMRVHAAVSSVAQFAAPALKNIACIQSGQQAAVDAGAPAVVIDAMRTHMAHSDIASDGCYALLNFAVVSAGRDAIINGGGVAMIVRAMRTHPTFANVAGNGALALKNVAVVQACQQACVDADAPLALVEALSAHGTSVAVASNACFALSSITTIKAGQEAAVNALAPAAIIAAMRAHRDSEGVAGNGCFALLNIAAIERGQQACVDVGAPAVIVGAMNRHAGNASVSGNGCWALNNIAWSLAHGKAAVREAGGVAAINAAMQRHDGASKLKGAEALSRLA
jgi:hypothetical protein